MTLWVLNLRDLGVFDFEGFSVFIFYCLLVFNLGDLEIVDFNLKVFIFNYLWVFNLGDLGVFDSDDFRILWDLMT